MSRLDDIYEYENLRQLLLDAHAATHKLFTAARDEQVRTVYRTDAVPPGTLTRLQWGINHTTTAMSALEQAQRELLNN